MQPAHESVPRARRRVVVRGRVQGVGFRYSVQVEAQRHGVVVAHGSAYGPGGEGTLRVSFASGGDNLARGLERLRAGLSAL